MKLHARGDPFAPQNPVGGRQIPAGDLGEHVVLTVVVDPVGRNQHALKPVGMRGSGVAQGVRLVLHHQGVFRNIAQA